MRLALIGKNIQHSKSPEIYKRLIGPHVVYDLIDVSQERDLPELDDLAQIYDAVNITSPYKKVYLDKIEVEESVLDLGCINTISFGNNFIGTNTDYYGLKIILQQFTEAEVILLGNGSMAMMTKKLIQELDLKLIAHFFRQKDGDISQLDLSTISKSNSILIINSCSRDYIFKGKLPKTATFLDYNYDYSPHHYLKSEIVYQDGLELLQLQALAAVEFWKRTHPKLK